MNSFFFFFLFFSFLFFFLFTFFPFYPWFVYCSSLSLSFWLSDHSVIIPFLRTARAAAFASGSQPIKPMRSPLIPCSIGKGAGGFSVHDLQEGKKEKETKKKNDQMINQKKRKEKNNNN